MEIGDQKSAEVRITTSHNGNLDYLVWIDDIPAIRGSEFEAIFGFEPPDGDYYVRFEMADPIEQPEYDSQGRLIGEV